MTRMISARFPGQCACGAQVEPGDRVAYNRRTRTIEACPACAGNDDGAHAYADVDTAYEDQCAAICGR